MTDTPTACLKNGVQRGQSGSGFVRRTAAFVLTKAHPQRVPAFHEHEVGKGTTRQRSDLLRIEASWSLIRFISTLKSLIVGMCNNCGLDQSQTCEIGSAAQNTVPRGRPRLGQVSSRTPAQPSTGTRLTYDGDYLMIDVIGETPAAQFWRADITTRVMGEDAETVDI